MRRKWKVSISIVLVLLLNLIMIPYAKPYEVMAISRTTTLTDTQEEDAFTDNYLFVGSAYSKTDRQQSGFMDGSATYFSSWVGADEGLPSTYQRSAIKLDISGISGTITSATLKIHVMDVVGDPIVNLIKTTDDTWSAQNNKFPNYSPTDYINGYSSTPVTDANSDITFTVTDYLQDRVDEEASYISFVLTGQEGSGITSYFSFVNMLNASGSGFTPSLTITYDAVNAPTVSSSESITNDATPTWTWSPDSTYPGKGTYRYKLDSDAWSSITTDTAYTPGSNLADGLHYLYVQESNGTNWSRRGSYTITVDTVPPSAPTVSSPESITNDATPTWTWTAGGGGNGTYRYELDDSELSSGATETTSTTFTAGVLSEGVHTLYVQEGDAAGNWSNSGNFAVTVDTAAPAAPTVPDMIAASDTGSSDTDNITNDTTPTFTGTAEEGSQVTLFDTDGTTDLGTCIADASTGVWTITSSAFAESSSGTIHNITAKAADAAGNISDASASVSITIDTAAIAPSVPDLATESDTGYSTSDDITNDTTPTFVGTAEAGSTVTLYESSAILGTAAADVSGNWSITSSELMAGFHSITAKATDIAGNVSVESGAIVITIDTVNPATVTSVTVKTAPTKTTYTAGDSLDLTGLVVTLHKSDSSAEEVAFADFGAKGITAAPTNGTVLSVSDTSVNIRYTADNKSVSQSITVSAAPVVNSATISPTGINYDLNSPADVVTTITWNSASTVTDVVYSTTSLTTPDVYVVSGSALTIKSSYINTLGISEGDDMKFKISFDKGNSLILTVNIVNSYTPSTNAGLNSLTVNDNPVSGFDPNTTIYNVALPYGTTSVLVGAVPEEAHAVAVIAQAQVLPGDATVVVTAEDKTTTKSYTIHFTLGAAPTTHSITLQSSGNGTVSANVYSAAKDTWVTLTAAPDTGYRFKEWQVVDGGVTITDNKFTMPDNHVTLKAIFEQIPATAYQVAVNGSYATTSGAGSYSAGDIVTVNAGSRSSYTFSGWTSADGIIFASVNSATTTFTMPAGNVTVTASWSYNGSSGGGGSNPESTGSSTTDAPDTIEVQQETKPDQPTIGAASVKAKKGTDNSAAVEISEKTVGNAIARAQAEAAVQEKTQNGIGVSLSVSSPAGTKSLGIVLTQPVLTQLNKAEVSQFEIDGNLGSLSFDLEAIKEIHKQGTGDVTINITPVTDLTGDAKTFVGTRPVYNISISYMKDGKTVNITSLGKGSVTLAIPYTPGKKESVGYLFGVYVDGKGNATRIEGSAYDANSKSVIFDSDHFSVYGVGYTAPSEKFKDISSHWAKESIDYVVGRGLFSGTSATAFSPNADMSRGMLVTALGRLAGVDVSNYKAVSFSDVAADKYYAPYIEWAYKKGIVSGIGNSKFAPDRSITHEEFALILSNYAKAAGNTLPVTRQAVAFADDSGIRNTYKEAIKAMQQAGIMLGGDGNKFNPGANATRAGVSTMLHRYIKLTIDPVTAQGWAVNDAGQRLYYKGGKALTGWQAIESKEYFFDNDGAMQTGWKKDDKDSWYYLSANGALAGWNNIGAKRYYFTEDAVMVFGKWLEIDSEWYYFSTDGSLAVSTTVDGYEVDKNGVRETK